MACLERLVAGKIETVVAWLRRLVAGKLDSRGMTQTVSCRQTRDSYGMVMAWLRRLVVGKLETFMAWLGRLVAGFSPRRHGINPGYSM
jgi:hypothetical protein